MRISEHYKLGRTQPTLDFVDVDISGDTRVFIDPRALRLLPSGWGDECVSLIQSFFRTVLTAIHESKHTEARRLLRVLREPNETHLGLSKGRSKGRGLGKESARDLWKALSGSEAVKSGLLEDLEDTILMVEGISSDIISDITTNIIRKPLIEYTQNMSSYYGIPLISDVTSGALWNPVRKEWYSEYAQLPLTRAGRLLLVPKVIVRARMDYDVEEYYRHYILEHLQESELAANTELVQLLKNGGRRVTKKDLEEKYGKGKSVVVELTRKHPEILDSYRSDKRGNYQPPLNHFELASSDGTSPPNWGELLREVTDVPRGREYFSKYEKVIEGLLTALFYPSLSNPQVQVEIHEGRKRIDITYTNVATSGFFFWLGKHYSAPHVFVECKNYVGDVGNPELDQLAGRFSPSRGQFGLLVCREFSDKDLFIKRCVDTAKDNRGFIIPIDDSDLTQIGKERKKEFSEPQFISLKERFDNLIM
ncbi:MAG: hypothetical protein M3430_20600 [Acidobacteriota bacterium]|nr:hypothetical protein [Acidobacteriota bacterium]